MSGFWKRVAVILGLREDPDYVADREAERPGAKKRAALCLLAAAIGLAGFSLLALLYRLIDGKETNPETIFWEGARRFGVALAIWVLLAAIRYVVRRYERSTEGA